MPAVTLIVSTALALCVSLYFVARLACRQLSRQEQSVLLVFAIAFAASAVLTLPSEIVSWLLFLLIISTALLIAFVDGRWLIIPDSLTLALGMAGLGWLIVTYRFEPQAIAIGASLGFAVMGATYVYFLRVRLIAGLGFGDVKLMSVIGGLVGPDGVPVVIVIASLATLVAFALFAFYERRRQDGMPAARSLRRSQMPFAPGLVIAMIAYLVFL